MSMEPSFNSKQQMEGAPANPPVAGRLALRLVLLAAEAKQAEGSLRYVTRTWLQMNLYMREDHQCRVPQ